MAVKFQGEVPVDEAKLSGEQLLELAKGGFRALAERTLIVAELDDRDRRIHRTTGSAPSRNPDPLDWRRWGLAQQDFDRCSPAQVADHANWTVRFEKLANLGSQLFDGLVGFDAMLVSLVKAVDFFRGHWPEGRGFPSQKGLGRKSLPRGRELNQAVVDHAFEAGAVHLVEFDRILLDLAQPVVLQPAFDFPLVDRMSVDPREHGAGGRSLVRVGQIREGGWAGGQIGTRRQRQCGGDRKPRKGHPFDRLKHALLPPLPEAKRYPKPIAKSGALD